MDTIEEDIDLLIDFMKDEEPSISMLDEAEISEEIAFVDIQLNDDEAREDEISLSPPPLPKYPFSRKPYITTRNLWYTDYTVPDKGYAKNAPPPKPEPPDDTPAKPGQQISAIEAINWSVKNNIDCRPKIFDNKTKNYYLLDTGAMTSCLPKQPEDQLDPFTSLKAANGKKMPTYGTREIEIRLGRKTYVIQAKITDVSQPILGMDLISKYRLGFTWIDDDLFITDNKANIKRKLQFTTIHQDNLPSPKVTLQAKLKNDSTTL